MDGSCNLVGLLFDNNFDNNIDSYGIKKRPQRLKMKQFYCLQCFRAFVVYIT